MRLILLRHGETQWNTQSRLQGHDNSSLSPKGIDQVKSIKKVIERLSPMRVVTSDLGRTIQTSEILGYPDAMKEPLLREVNMGEWTGKYKEDLITNQKQQYSDWRAGLYTPSEGESWVDFCDRIGSTLKQWAEKEESDLLAIVHSGVIRAACKVFLNLSPEYLLPVTPGTISIFNFENKSIKLEAYNIGAYIPDDNVAD